MPLSSLTCYLYYFTAPNGSRRITRNERRDLGRHLVEVAYEGKAGAIRDEGARVERQFDRLLHQIGLVARLAVHAPNVLVRPLVPMANALVLSTWIRMPVNLDKAWE